MVKPEGFDKWNPAMRGAFKKGYEAYQEKQPKTANPYIDKRKDCGRLTWSRAFMACWQDGWEWAEKQSKVKTQVSAFSRLA